MFTKSLLISSPWNAKFVTRWNYPLLYLINTSPAKHGTQLEKICVYCGVGFDDAQKFFKHLLEKHGLPPPIDSIKEKTKPISSAFTGALKVFKIIGSGENDLLQFMTDVRPQIDQLVTENVNRTSQKMQLVLRTELSKPTNGEETELFLRSHMVPVYGNTLPQNYFLAAVDKMINFVYIHCFRKWVDIG